MLFSMLMSRPRKYFTAGLSHHNHELMIIADKTLEVSGPCNQFEKISRTATKPQFVEGCRCPHIFFFFSVIQTFLLKCLLSGAMGRVLSGPCCISDLTAIK